jgi:hypothetical protein
MVTRNPNWSLKILCQWTGYAKEKIILPLTSLVRSRGVDELLCLLSKYCCWEGKCFGFNHKIMIKVSGVTTLYYGY